MIKRITSFILSMLLVLVPAAFVSAEDTVETTVDIQVYTLNVTVKTSINSGNLTLKVYPLAYDETSKTYSIVDAEHPIYVDQASNPTAEGALYVYQFNPFNFKESQETGQYRAVINKNYTYDFEFVNKQDKIDFYNQLSAASAGAIEGLLKNGLADGVIDFDLGNYFEYPAEVKTNINEALVNLDLPSLGSNPSDDLVKSFEAILKPEFARLLKVAEFVTAAEAEFDEAVQANAKELGLDLNFYGDTKLGLDPKNVYKRLKSLTIESFAAQDVQYAFDTAVLLDMLDEADYGAVTEALDYYDGGCINLDKSVVKGFTESQLNEVSRLMKQHASEINSAEDIESAYETYADQVAGEDDDNNSSSGGGSSSSGGSGSNRRPSTGSGSTITDDNKDDNNDVTYDTNFSDLGDAAWAESSVKYLASKGIISGKGDGRFYPNDTVTREEFVKIIVEAFKIYSNTATVEFEDVDSGRWSYGYIASAYRAGIIAGNSDTTFNPAGEMTRQDMAVIMYRVANLVGLGLNSADVTFADGADIADYAKEAVGALCSAGIINGTGDNCFSPLETVTRAQAAKIAYELMNAIGGAN
ncbi:MAG TPA: hypothetical protein DD391_09370 [Clostridiales bacterium]|jgi:plasmid maintenance system killer protein|uniref:S-layer homology domain-containing protein n=1 Tax=Congzhengia minquanensis TaxID=2763657 RepID=A0A926HZR8_9FIRM|nr:S-layer homology domain-containing protein [Congzhengia minquanensis]MBC8541146.1 S-layer homology domain-containing protein [Congzhengia minquanensis]MBD8947042.1 S-layer homology domain-containing protein [Clostridiales bacterium]HBL82776.1 hypothetical protein [Clostridiales bacterium]